MAVSTYSQAAVDALSAAMQNDPSIIALGEDIGRGEGRIRRCRTE